MKQKILLLFLVCFSGSVIFSQNSSILITGKVTIEKNEPAAGATVKIKNGTLATHADPAGKFSLAVPSLPVTLQISFSEYETGEINVSDNEELIISLIPIDRILNPIVIAGDRVERKLTQSAVSVERVGKVDFINSASDPFGHLLSKKGLDVTVSSLTYKTYSTRGFNGSGSSRVNQLMDGMDNQAPGLNFSVGNFVGLTDLDIESIEILPGASSALYGPGGLNGTLLLTSKNPFKYPGLSVQVKNGVTDIGKDQRAKAGAFHDYTLRWAKNFKDKFAFKIGVQYLQANDWLANDTSNYQRSGASGKVIAGTRQTDPNYDGVNVYGDETSLSMQFISNAVLQAATEEFRKGYFNAYNMNPSQAEINGFLSTNATTIPFYFGLQNNLIPNQNVSRTGYQEIETIDPKTKNIKLSGAIHYNLNKNIEAILAGHWATGNTVYSGNNRYALKDIKIGQYKLELKHKHWFLRGYTTQEDAGEAYSATVTSQYVNEAWKSSNLWYPEYIGAFVQARGAGAPEPLAHTMARNYADRTRPAAGSAEFKQFFDQVRKTPIPNGGLFLEKSQLWIGEGQYNFSDKIKFAEIVVGGNVKKYILNSQGTLFIDSLNLIKINEWGAYAQVTKKLFSDKLVLSAASRFDKNENFKGKFTPRITALINVAERHNFRMSYQTAYKFPTTQQQWIRLDVGNVILLGGLPWINSYMNTKANQTLVYNPPNPPVPFVYKELKPESMRSFEIGYKSIINKKLLLDMYVYFGKYTDFLGRIVLIQPATTNKPYSIVVNSDNEVNTWGAGIGFDYKMAKNFFTSFNASTDNLTNVPTGFMAGFNTPKYRMNAGFGNSGIGKTKRAGFSVNLRWQDDFFWEGAGLADGTVKAYSSLDAQVNYKLPKIKSMIKLGGTNITNKFYQTGFGNPYIGGMYYASFVYNIL